MTTLQVHRPDDLGPGLREARIAEDITQSALADIAGVGRQWLNAFELGDKPSAPLDMVMRVIAAIGIPVTLTWSTPGATPAFSPEAEDEPVDLDAHLDRFQP